MVLINKEQEWPYLVNSSSTLEDLTGRFVFIRISFSFVVP